MKKRRLVFSLLFCFWKTIVFTSDELLKKAKEMTRIGKNRYKSGFMSIKIYF